MGALSLYLLYWHFGAYLLYADLQKRMDQVESTADTLITAYALESAASGAEAPVGPVTAPPPRREAFFAAAQENFPGLKVELGAGQELLARGSGGRRPRFEGLVEDHGTLKLRAVTARRLLNGQEIVLSAEVPVTPEFVADAGAAAWPRGSRYRTRSTAGAPTRILLSKPRQHPRPCAAGAGCRPRAASSAALVRLQSDRLRAARCRESGRRLESASGRAGDRAIHGVGFADQWAAARAGRRMGRHSRDGVTRGRGDFSGYRICRLRRQHLPDAFNDARRRRPLSGHALRRIRRFQPSHRNPAARSARRSGELVQLHDRVRGDID